MVSEGTRSIRTYISRIPSWLEPALCAALAALLFWKGILPAWRTLNTDFPNYYLVARLLREGYSLERIYDWIWLQRIKDHWGLDQSLVGFAGLTPFSALPIVPLSVFPALIAKRVWILFNLLFLAATVELLHRSTSPGRRRIWLLALLAILPLRTSFLFGQMHLAVLVLLVLAYYFQSRHREIACGTCIALAGALKVYPLSFMLYFLWKRQWRPALAMLGAVVLIILAGGLWMGWDLLHIYATQILPRSLQGETLDPYNLHAESAAALLHRLFLFEPTLNPSPLFASPSLYAVLYPLWQMTILVPLLALLRPFSNSPGREQLEWGAFVFSLLVLSPVPSSYHFVVMILPIVLLIDSLLRRNQAGLALISIALYTLISTIDFFTGSAAHLRPAAATLLGFSRLWLVIALFIVFLISLRQYSSAPNKLDPVRGALLAVFTLAVLTISIAGYRHHFAHREQEISHRISMPSTTYLATDPQPIPGSYLFVAMLPRGYRILDQQGHEAAPLETTPNFTDRLSFAVFKDGSPLTVEEASVNGSSIIRAADRDVVAQDAESPAISPDGRNLAFVRESKGRGSLWITALGQEPDSARHALPNSPIGVLDRVDYNVRNASFLHSGTLLFVAKHDGRSGLFSIAPGGRPVPFLTIGGDIGSFAASPDEHHIALTELIDNRWQLISLDLRTDRQDILTFGDCNAYSPIWATSTQITYATDCGRGFGLTALASISTKATSAP